MSQFFDYGENLIADYFRGQGLAALPAQFYVGLASAVTDISATELSGGSYARQPYGRGLTQFSGTQASGTTTASAGTSHSISNNNLISFGTASSAWGTANFAVLFNALSGGNAVCYFPITPIVVSSGSAVSIAIGGISFSLALAGCTNYLVNKVLDLFFRAQAYTFPTSACFGLFNTAPTNAGGGVEVSGSGYARQSTPFSLAGFSSTVAPADTGASTGTGGIISNNFTVSFPTPLANWGTIEAEGVFDSLAGGNLLFWNMLSPSRSILSGSSPQTHAPGSWSITVA